MAERELKKRPTTSREATTVEEEAPATAERGDRLKAEIDDLLGRDRRGPREQRRGVRPQLRSKGGRMRESES